MEQLQNRNESAVMPARLTAVGKERNRTSYPLLTQGTPWRLVQPANSGYSYAPVEERRAAADILNAHLLMVEIMMCNITQKYVYEVITELSEKGMLRHNIKRRAKALQNLSADLIKRSNVHDAMQVRTFAQPILPSLVDAYISEGGTLVQKLQALFSKEYGSDLSLIYCATKNALDKARIEESALVSNVQMISLLAHTGIDFYNYICRKVDALLAGIGNVKRIKSQHNEQMLAAAKDLLRELKCGGVNLPEKESQDVRTLAAQFQQKLVSEDLLHLIENGIIAMQMDYTEFVIASLRLGCKLSISDIKSLMFRLGKKGNVARLLNEIKEIPMDEHFEGDIFDFMESLPGSKDGTALFDFRRLCMKDHILIDPESSHEVRMRKLRLMAYRNNGVLEVNYLKYLYFRLGTKKAVQEYMEGAGDVMHRSLSLLKRIKASELCVSKNKSGLYRMNLGRAVKAMLQQRGMKEKTLASRLSADLNDVYQIEELNDISGLWSNSLKRVIYGLSSVFNIAPAYLLFLTLESVEKEGIALSQFYKHIEWIGENELIDKKKSDKNGNTETNS